MESVKKGIIAKTENIPALDKYQGLGKLGDNCVADYYREKYNVGDIKLGSAGTSSECSSVYSDRTLFSINSTLSDTGSNLSDTTLVHSTLRPTVKEFKPRSLQQLMTKGDAAAQRDSATTMGLPMPSKDIASHCFNNHNQSFTQSNSIHFQLRNECKEFVPKFYHNYHTKVLPDSLLLKDKDSHETRGINQNRFQLKNKSLKRFEPCQRSYDGYPYCFQSSTSTSAMQLPSYLHHRHWSQQSETISDEDLKTEDVLFPVFNNDNNNNYNSNNNNPLAEVPNQSQVLLSRELRLKLYPSKQTEETSQTFQLEVISQTLEEEPTSQNLQSEDISLPLQPYSSTDERNANQGYFLTFDLLFRFLLKN